MSFLLSVPSSSPHSAGLKDNTFTKCFNWTEPEQQRKLITSFVSVADGPPDLLPHCRWIRILILSHRATLWSVLLGFIVWIPKIRDVFWEDRRTLIYKQVPGNWPLRRDNQDIIVSRNRHTGLNVYSASGLARCKWICFFTKTYLEKFNIIWIAHQESSNSW